MDSRSSISFLIVVLMLSNDWTDAARRSTIQHPGIKVRNSDKTENKLRSFTTQNQESKINPSDLIEEVIVPRQTSSLGMALAGNNNKEICPGKTCNKGQHLSASCECKKILTRPHK